MDSGFCVRVLLLSLSFGQLTKAYGGRNIKLYPKAETNPQSYKPASNYETSVPPRVSLAGSRLPQTGLSQSVKSSTPARFQGQSDHGRQVDGYSQPRSVSSYRPASLWSNTRQASHQPVKGIYQGQDRAWETVSPRSNFGSGTVSSGAIEMHSGPLASQQSGSSNVLKGKAGMWNSPTPRSGDVPRSDSYSPHGATSYVPLQPHKPHPKPVAARPNVQPASSRWTSGYNMGSGQSGSSNVLQSKAGMWNNPLHSGEGPKPDFYSSYGPFKPEVSDIKMAAPLSPRMHSPDWQKNRASIQPISSRKTTPSRHTGKTQSRLSPSQTQMRLGVQPKPSQQGGSQVWSGVPSTRVTAKPAPAKPHQKPPGSQPASVPLPSTDKVGALGSTGQEKADPRSFKQVPISSLYHFGGERPQLRSMYNRNRQLLTP